MCLIFAFSSLPMDIFSVIQDWTMYKKSGNDGRTKVRRTSLDLQILLFWKFTHFPPSLALVHIRKRWIIHSENLKLLEYFIHKTFQHQSHPIPDYLMHFIFYFFHWLAMSGSILNPLVYAYFNENFRRHIQANFIFLHKILKHRRKIQILRNSKGKSSSFIMFMQILIVWFKISTMICKIQLCCVDFRNNGSFKHGFYTVITPNALQARYVNIMN